ncbi:MAG TPA: GNAT family N-acetyltransferase [Clostridia bacterium]
MLTIRRAELQDSEFIYDITKKAFKVYQNALGEHAHFVSPALLETIDDVKHDITHNNVLIAVMDSKLVGSIRYKSLSDQLAYIYRFGVDPELNNNGVGSALINAVIDECTQKGYKAIALHTNAKYFKLAKYYYGREFYVHSTDFSKGYIRALFVKELNGGDVDLTPALEL